MRIITQEQNTFRSILPCFAQHVTTALSITHKFYVRNVMQSHVSKVNT